MSTSEITYTVLQDASRISEIQALRLEAWKREGLDVKSHVLNELELSIDRSAYHFVAQRGTEIVGALRFSQHCSADSSPIPVEFHGLVVSSQPFLCISRLVALSMDAASLIGFKIMQQGILIAKDLSQSRILSCTSNAQMARAFPRYGFFQHSSATLEWGGISVEMGLFVWERT